MSYPKSMDIDRRHFLLFGAILQTFAAHELLIARIAAHILGTEIEPIIILMRSLSFEEKCKALLDLLRHRGVPLDRYDRVNTFLTFLLTFVRLRRELIHSVWSEAPSPTALQPDWILHPVPRIAPLNAAPNTAPGYFVEKDYETLTYSLGELNQIAKELDANLASFSGYVADVDLIGH
jgi:hypothetical protein